MGYIITAAIALVVGLIIGFMYATYKTYKMLGEGLSASMALVAVFEEKYNHAVREYAALKRAVEGTDVRA